MIEFKVVIFYNENKISEFIYKYKSLANFNRFKLEKLTKELDKGYSIKVYQKSEISDLQKLVHNINNY